MKNIKPNDLNSIVSSFGEGRFLLEENKIKYFKLILNDYAGDINSCKLYISKYLIPRVDPSSYEYRELKDVENQLNICHDIIHKLIENENNLNLIVDKEK
jgi:hypothetical protein